jgi:prevent-host-death family protein
MTISLNDAKTHLSALIERVKAGEEITITKHGKPVAKLSPATNANRRKIGLHEREYSAREMYEATRSLTDEELEDWQ